MKRMLFLGLGLFDRDPIVVGGTGGSTAPLTQDAGPEILDEVITESVELSGANVESTFDLVLNIPANKLKKGDIVEATWHVIQNGRNAADTTQIKVHLDNASGAILYDSTALNAPAGQHLPTELKFVVASEGAAGSIKALGYIPFGATGGNAAVAYDTTTARKLVVTAMHSTNNVGNKTQIKWAVAKLFRKV